MAWKATSWPAPWSKAQRAGKDLTREKLISALESLSNTDLGGYRLTYSPTRPGSRFVELTGRPGRAVLK
jgi:hypothetical protein